METSKYKYMLQKQMPVRLICSRQVRTTFLIHNAVLVNFSKQKNIGLSSLKNFSAKYADY